MASLTESYPISDLITNKSKSNTPNNNDWYDSVYLCIQNSSVTSPHIDGFKCFKFSNFKEADDYFNKTNNKNLPENKEYHRHTMIPVCKWTPLRLHKFVLNYKLQNLFWKNNITLMVKKY